MTPTPDSPVHATRRGFLRGAAGVVAAGAIAPAMTATAAPATHYRIAVSDRAVGYRQELGVFALARHVGMAGVEVDCGRLGAASDMDNCLLEPHGRHLFASAAAEAGVTVSSLAMTAFAAQSFVNHPKADDYADDLVYALRETGVRVGVLPVRIDDAGQRARVIERLKRVAPAAERDHVVIALDTNLSATETRDLLDAIGSPAIQSVIYAGPGDAAAGALAILGAARVAQVRYRHDEADAAGQAATLAAFSRVLDAAGWRGWFVIDRPAMSAAEVDQNLAMAANRLTAALATAVV